MRKLFTLILIVLSIPAFSVSVTFQVKLSGQALPKDTVYIVGYITNWQFQPMIDLGDSLYTWSTDLEPGTVDNDGNDSLAYYFITVNSWDSAGNQDWNYYKRYREWFDTICSQSYPLRYGTDRWIVVPDNDTVVMCYFAKCPNYTPPSGINEKETNTLNFVVYPNPAEGDVTIRLSDMKSTPQIELYDIAGRILAVDKTIVNSGEIKLGTAALSSGIYFVKVYDGRNTGVRKIIVR